MRSGLAGFQGLYGRAVKRKANGRPLPRCDAPAGQRTFMARLRAGQPMGLTKVPGWVAPRWSTRVSPSQGHSILRASVSLGGVISTQAGW